MALNNNEQELLDGLFKHLYGVAKQFILLNEPEIGRDNAHIMVSCATEKLAELFRGTYITEEAGDAE